MSDILMYAFILAAFIFWLKARSLRKEISELKRELEANHGEREKLAEKIAALRKKHDEDDDPS